MTLQKNANVVRPGQIKIDLPKVDLRMNENDAAGGQEIEYDYNTLLNMIG